uniref:Transmembrane 9 superfamily member n=1 Tax=Parastrongyloides trichosuri TaxID=131310 RepID=A0A0N5A1G2_PARTI
MFQYLFLCSLFILPTNEFYVPGVAPVQFKTGDPIEIKGIKLESTKTGLPYEYYSIPFCKPPPNKLHYKSENIGELMRGDRIVNTLYEVKMKRDIDCASVCQSSNIFNIPKDDSYVLRKRIEEDYHVHLLIDNLPCATKFTDPETGEVFYDHGYRLGYMNEENNRYYVNNHLDIVLKYHEPEPGVYRVVGFEVQPRSISHDSYSFSSPQQCTIDQSKGPQEIENNENDIFWTYSIKWEESDIPWASRWDSYLNMKDHNIHYFSILNSIIIVGCLAGFLSAIIVKTVRRDIATYNKNEEMEDTLEESGWKLVHGDVFRPPRHQMILVNFVGSGIQLIGMVAITVTFAMLGMLSPSSRGSLATAAISLFCLMGLVSGYHSGRLYKTLKGRNPKRCAFQTATLFPGIILCSGFVINFFLISKHSSGAIPFTSMLTLLFLWFGVDLPLVFLGFHFGYRKHPYHHPVRTNQIPRQVPDQPWYLRTLPSSLLAGILPFGAVFIELYFIFSAIWENQFYYLFGFLFIVCIIVFVVCCQIAVLVTYFLLCAENYHWWWKSFVISGGSAIYVMAYSIFYYYTKLNLIGFVPMVLYFSYSALMAFSVWIMTGSIGFYAAYYFLLKIYSAVKID